jgi:hypothetical protein
MTAGQRREYERPGRNAGRSCAIRPERERPTSRLLNVLFILPFLRAG